ncbi:MAG: GNAT family N-acetyltransferase [Phormidesmis sp.]
MDNRHIQFCYMQFFSPSQLNQLCDLFKLAAFWAQARSPRGMAQAIAHSKPVVAAWDDDQLIGFARATSDGLFRATIWDVVIHPRYQGLGLGRRLVETLIAHPHMNKVERTYLMTTHQQSFYERIGFECNSTTTMVLHNRPITDCPRPAELVNVSEPQAVEITKPI